MDFTQTVQLLSPYHAKFAVNNDSNTRIDCLLPISIIAGQPLVNTAYIVRKNELKILEQISANNLTLIFIGEEFDLPQIIYQKVSNLIFISDEQYVDQITYDFYQKQLLEESIHNAMRTLTEALFSNKGTQHILDVSYSIIRNPLFIFEKGTGKMQFACSQDVVDSNLLIGAAITSLGSHQLNNLDSIIASGLISYQQISSLRDLRNVSDQYSQDFNEVMKCDQLTSVIKVHEIEVGFVLCLAKEHPFTDYDIEYFRRISMLISQELQKRSLYTRSHGELKSQFLNYLLNYNGNLHELTYQKERIRQLVELHDKYYIGVISPSDSSARLDTVTLGLLEQTMRSQFYDCFYMEKDNEFIIFFNLRSSENIRLLIGENLENIIMQGSLILGVSNMFHDLSSVKNNYDEAVDAINTSVLYEQEHITYFSDIAPMEALRVLGNSTNPLKFCAPELLDLLDYDEKHGTQFTLTLYVYLDNVGNTALAAKKLFIHKNTLLYRLGKIKEILNNDLTSGEDIYKLMQSMRILRTQHIISWEQEVIQRYGII